MPSLIKMMKTAADELKAENPEVAAVQPVSQPVAPKPPEPVQMRQFGDTTALRKAIYDNTLKAAQAVEPVSNTRYSLHLSNPQWIDPETRPLSDDKQAILTGGSMLRRMRGTWHLKDPQGNTVAEKTSTIAHIPYLTNRGTFVMGGSEYTLGHQMRLRPGVFTRIKENGELEAHINIMPGKGLSHRYFLEPETGIFKIHIGQASLPMYTMLRALGTSDDELRKTWGPELFAANKQKDDPRVLDKLYERLIGKRGPEGASMEDKRKLLSTTITNMELDPEVTKRTLGQPHSHLTKDAALATTKKLLAISRGEADTDDRDHLAYQHFLGPEDLMAERIGRDKNLLRELLWKATTKGNLDTLPTGAFTKSVHDSIFGSGLGQSVEEINNLDLLDQQTRVSRLGFGGIPSVDAIPDEARSVQPSHLGYIDLIRTPESLHVGVDSRVGYTSVKGSDKRIYTPMYDARTHQNVYKSPQDVADSVIAFPGQMENGKRLVAANVNGKVRYVPREKVDYVLPHMEQAFSPINNLVPLKSALKGQRAAMASRFITQALPLHEADSPYVRGQVPGQVGRSFEEHYGNFAGAVKAKDMSGRVASVDDNAIKVKYADGTTETHEIYHNHPHNRKTFIHNTPMVQPGDPVKPGQLLAKSNYTDDKGHVALGKNLRTAYIPFRGTNYEDAYVIGESAAKLLSSEHMYQHNMDWDELHRRGKKNYISIFPGRFEKKVLNSLDNEGIIQPGTVVNPGDPLIVAAREREISKKQIHTAHKGSFADDTVTWDHHSPGLVTDVAKTDKGVTVAVKSFNQMQVGDKISGRMGDKGIVGAIVPDEEMPHDAQGRPFHVLANPLGVITRTNPSQVIEAALGKISEKTGKPYIIDDFGKIPDLSEYAQKELEKHGLKGAEDIVDPVTGRRIPNVMTGNRFYMKLHHTSESKNQGRGLGSYTAEGLPAKGGVGGSKRMALMDVTSLLSHGAIETLRDAKLIRGQKNQEYWSNFMSGFRPPTPAIPMVYNKFINELKAAGINVQRIGTQTHIMAMTDKDIDELSGDRALEHADTVDWKASMAPIKGGLFDEKLTGGHNGNRWSHIKLSEPMPNPVFEEPIRRLLKLTKNKFEDVLSGREPLYGRKGPEAIQAALAAINVPQAIEQARADIQSGRRTARDEAIKRLGFLKGSEKNGIHPKDWMVSKVPVLPPLFRPVSIMQGTGGRLVSDANYLYKEVFDANKNLESLKDKVDDVSNERVTLYNTFKAIAGLGDPVQPKNQERKVKGMLQQIFGHSPKYSFVQQKLLGTTVDLVGRSVVIPNPDLNMDQIGLPEERAWEVYTPFIARRLVRRGVPRLQALQYVKDRHQLARGALLDEINERPVIMTRAPVLHRYGEMSFFPRLTKGDSLQVSPIIVGGFGMDFDGDAVNYHVPASDEAATELAEKLLPSRNLLSTQNFKALYTPRQEYLGGLASATKNVDSEKHPRTFATRHEALQAYYRGEMDPDQPIHILDEKK